MEPLIPTVVEELESDDDDDGDYQLSTVDVCLSLCAVTGVSMCWCST